MIKKLIKHGNSKAILIDKTLLEEAGLTEDSLFQIAIGPSGGLIIQSVDDQQPTVFQENFEKLNKQYKNLMQRLADL